MATTYPAPSRMLPPEPTIRRLPWYLAYVSGQRTSGVEYVSSTNIAKAINVDPAQIAKDLSVLGLKGKTRIGYATADLEAALLDFLGFARLHKAVIMGVGSLGAALIADSGLERFGLDIVAGFDINPAIAGKTIGSVPVMLPDRLAQTVRAEGAEIGIVAVPVGNAQEAADSLVAAGVKALWNFTPMRIRTAPGIVIQNTSIYAHLAVMYNRLSATRQSADK